MKNNSIILIAFAVILSSCIDFETNIYSTEVSNEEHTDLNNKNLQKLQSKPDNNDTIIVAFTGDSQRFYDQLASLIKKVNTLKDVDFLVLAGDVSDFSLRKEYEWVNERLDQLKVPYFMVVGNHDLIANNSAVFEKVYGSKNFSFQFKNYIFLLHDTNSREYNYNGKVPDLNWLKQEIEKNKSNWVVPVSHVPPFDIDFDRKLEKEYVDLFSTNNHVNISLHGHMHNFSDNYHYNDGTRYITAASMNKNNFVLLKLINGEIYLERIYY